MVLRLPRALYGLRQAPRAWSKCLEQELKSRGFVRSESGPLFLLLCSKSGAVLVMFYVDDGLVAARTAAEADRLVKTVWSMFAIRELGEPADFVGIQIKRDEKAGTVSIKQTRQLHWQRQ
jgi:hypothetical protein